jgi:branched-chain amino acid aminotransferase
MAVKVWIQGEIFDEDAARVPVFDRGFLYGDSVYEVMRTAGGHPVALADHVTRLARSAAAIGLPLPSAEHLTAALQTTLAAAGNRESYARIMITRGSGPIGLDPALARDPLTIVIVKPLELPAAAKYERGIGLAIVSVERTSPRAVDPSVKSGNYLNSILAIHEARRAGADEALMCDAAGRVAEGSSSNVFLVRAGRLATPALEVGILGGITRQRVLALARQDGLGADETTLLPVDVRSADEVFITSSIRGILPVARVDAQAIGDDAPGPITRRLMARYAADLDRIARGGL